MEKIVFVTYTEDFLNLSWKWLNDPEIKRLTNTPNFTKEMQENWFRTLEGREDYKVWGIQHGNKKIGVVGLKRIQADTGEYFGYIGDKSFWNKGISKQMIDKTCEYAKERGIKDVWLTVINENERAIRAYEKYGFKPFEKNANEIKMRYLIV